MDITGIIDEVNNFGVAKGSHIKVNGQKYSCYSPTDTGLDTVSPGQEVTFEAFEKNGYTNIKGRITPTGNTGTPKAQIPNGVGTKTIGGKGASDFPIGPLDGRRNITRRDALREAVTLVCSYTAEVDTSMTLSERVQQVMWTAEAFEAYASGDNDVAAAEVATQELAEPTGR